MATSQRVEPTHPHFGTASPGSIDLECGVDGVAFVDAIAHAQQQIGGGARGAQGQAVALFGLAAGPLHAGGQRYPVVDRKSHARVEHDQVAGL